MVKRITPALGGSDGYIQVILDLVLPDKVSQTARSQTDIKGFVFLARFT
jgi:hypothetical protein